MTIKDDDKNQVIYATSTDIFSKALENTIKAFVGTDNYQKYLDNTQEEITDTGTIIENVYIENAKTLKETYISTDEKIYTDSDELSKYLLFGENVEKTSYTVKSGDTIESIAFDNKISVEELLLSNDDITNAKNLLYVGQNVQIAVTDPQIKVVVEEYVVEDVENKFSTIEEYSNELAIGNNQVTQYGSNGIDRVSRDIKKVNGLTTYVNTQSKVEIKPTVNQIVLIGQKYIPTVGSLTVWAWPTNSGFYI